MSNIQFYTKKDVQDSLLISNNGLTINDEKVSGFLTQTNNEYERLCNQKGVYGDDITVNDQSTDDFDERNSAMVLLCEHFFLMKAFFSLSKEKEDIYWFKYLESKSSYKDSMNLVSYDKIIGDRPPVTKAGAFISVPMGRG